MKSFAEIYERAAIRKGGDLALQELLPVIDSNLLANMEDDRILSAMTKQIFRAGFVWKVVDNMWPAFETAFWQFDLWRCAYMSSEQKDSLIVNASIIRNGQKIETVPANASFMLEIREQHGTFAQFLQQWPEDDLVGLLAFLKKNGSRLGGMTAQYFLRVVGKDGFILGSDGVAALIDAGVIDKTPTSKSAMQAVQAAYNTWREESELNYAQISRVLAMSIDA